MPYRKQVFHPGATFHIYNRGVARQAIFFNSHQYEFFLRRLSDLVCPVASLIAHCEMPNHYHLVVRITREGFSNAMQRFTASFVKAVNKAQSREGPLFQSPFRAIEVREDRYLATLVDYVHRNPVAAGLVNQPGDWPYSSYAVYAAQGLLAPDRSILQSLRDRDAMEWPSIIPRFYA